MSYTVDLRKRRPGLDKLSIFPPMSQWFRVIALRLKAPNSERADSVVKETGSLGEKVKVRYLGSLGYLAKA